MKEIEKLALTPEQYLIDNKLNDLVISKSTTNGKYVYVSDAIEGYQKAMEAQKQPLKTITQSDEDRFMEIWYNRNPCHDLDQEGKDRFWKTAIMVAQEFVSTKQSLEHKQPAMSLEECNIRQDQWVIKNTENAIIEIVNLDGNEIALIANHEKKLNNALIISKSPEVLAILIELLSDLQEEVLSTSISDTINRAKKLIEE